MARNIFPNNAFLLLYDLSQTEKWTGISFCSDVKGLSYREKLHIYVGIFSPNRSNGSWKGRKHDVKWHIIYNKEKKR